MSWPHESSSPYPISGLLSMSGGDGRVVGAHQRPAGFGFTRAVRWQLAALAAILLATMAFLGFAAEVMGPLLITLLTGVAVDAAAVACGGGAQRVASDRDAS